MMYRSVAFIIIVAAVGAKVYFKENFNDAGWEDRWIASVWKQESDLGAWKHTAGEFARIESDKGIQTSEDARFYAISAKLDSAFTNRDKELVIQMSVKHEQDLNCGGAYIKLLGDMDQSKFGGDTPYQVMFGPDICGPSNKKTHVIFNYPPKNENLLIKDQVKVESDKLSHLYTLVVKPDNTFEVLIDLVTVKSGTLVDNWDFLASHHVPDVAVSDSNSATDEEAALHVRCTDCTHIGFELWQSRAGTIFDDIIVTDSLEEAKAYAAETFLKKQGPEKEKYEAARHSRDGIVLIAYPARVFPAVASQQQSVHVPAQGPVPPPPVLVDPATRSRLIPLNTVSTLDVLNVTVTNPLNGHSIQWAPILDGGAELNVMDSRTASLLSLKPGYSCTVNNHAGWMSVVQLDVQGKLVDMAVCVSTIGYNLFGKPLLEEQGLCHCPKRGIVECKASVVVFSV